MMALSRDGKPLEFKFACKHCTIPHTHEKLSWWMRRQGWDKIRYNRSFQLVHKALLLRPSSRWRVAIIGNRCWFIIIVICGGHNTTRRTIKSMDLNCPSTNWHLLLADTNTLLGQVLILIPSYWWLLIICMIWLFPIPSNKITWRIHSWLRLILTWGWTDGWVYALHLSSLCSPNLWSATVSEDGAATQQFPAKVRHGMNEPCTNQTKCRLALGGGETRSEGKAETMESFQRHHHHRPEQVVLKLIFFKVFNNFKQIKITNFDQ